MGDEARILIVCTGNICRSPFIERLLQRRLDERRSTTGRAGSDGAIVVRSAGTGALAGWPMDERAAAQLVAHGGDPAGFSARQLTPALIAESDLVLTATRAHRGTVAAMRPTALRRVFTFRDFADLVKGIDGLSARGAGNAGNARALRADPGAWVRQVAEEAAAGRGLSPPLKPAAADIVDPYGRRAEFFAAMAEQVVGSMPAVVRALTGCHTAYTGDDRGGP
jgi:protein-tyrosine phosphatase